MQLVMRFGSDTDQREEEVDRRFGKYVATKRDLLQLTLEEVEEMSGISKTRWVAIEKGAAYRAVTVKEIQLIAEIIEEPVEQLKKKALGET